MMTQELALVVINNNNDDDEFDAQTGRGLVIDSLPYVDSVHEDYESYALALIEDEMQHIHPPKIRKMSPVRCRSDFMRTEIETLATSQSRPTLDLESKTKAPSSECVEEWRRAVAAARCEYEAQRQRSMILEIEKSDVSAQQWKLYTSRVLEEIQGNTQYHLSKEKSRVDETNAERQKQQHQAGHTLSILTNQWHQLAHKKFSLEMAIRDLDAEVQGLRDQSESN
jgi:hypothetical protein